MVMRAIPLRGRAYEVHDEDAAYEAARRRFALLVRLLARRLAPGDEDLADDLQQVAWVALWQIDPSRFGPGDLGYVKQVLWSRMLNTLDQERRESHRPRVFGSDGVWVAAA